MRNILENATGLPIDACISWNFEKLRKMVDSVGGVDISLNQEFIDNYQEGWFKNVKLKDGVNHFNGEQALQYARVRKKDTDVDRNSRQMQVVKAMMRQLLNRARSDILQVPGIAGEILNQDGSSHVFSDVNTGDVIGLFAGAVFNPNTSKELSSLMGQIDQISALPLDWVDGNALVQSYPQSLVEKSARESNRAEYWQLFLKSPKIKHDSLGLPVDPDNPLDYWDPLRNQVRDYLTK
jgi:hypothetical protein